jgi:hypothetical protein
VRRAILSVAIAAALSAGILGGTTPAQIAEYPQDPVGFAIPYRLVHLIHSSDRDREGCTADLMAHDPFLLYQLGRDLLHRQFELRHGVLGRSAVADVPLYVGVPPMPNPPFRFARDHSTSCGMCHSSVYREPASGQTIASTGPLGRNSTHFFGAGLVEMIGAQVRQEILRQYDANGDGVIGRAEVRGLRPVRIAPVPGGPVVDYGDLSPGDDGVPRLNTVFRVWYVGEDGRVIPDAFGLDDVRVAGFGFAMQPFGWGRGHARIGSRLIPQGGEASTVREFFTQAADQHMGLQAHDPTQRSEHPSVSGYGGLARVSLAGARQFDFGGSVDPGRRLAPGGISLDDPDQDGHFEELSEGDVDAIEYYLLHTPPPTRRSSPQGEQGRETLKAIGCTRCHVEDWHLRRRDDVLGFAGDRRLFHLATSSENGPDGRPQIIGRLERLWRTDASGAVSPRADRFVIERIYSDFKHWDVGTSFHERRFDATLQKSHRTAPLWGVGSSAPYGHSGQYQDLHGVIAAHGGEAQLEQRAYLNLDAASRAALLEYLESLVLYSTDGIPADIDDDGSRATEFRVSGIDVGPERFDARFLFHRLPHYRRLAEAVQPDGRKRPLALITSVSDAYGFDLQCRLDTDEDGFPDEIDPLPYRSGLGDHAQAH